MGGGCASQRWLNELEIVWYEGKQNLHWAAILKEIRQDPKGFVEDGGFDMFLGERSLVSLPLGGDSGARKESFENARREGKGVFNANFQETQTKAEKRGTTLRTKTTRSTKKSRRVSVAFTSDAYAR